MGCYGSKDFASGARLKVEATNPCGPTTVYSSRDYLTHSVTEISFNKKEGLYETLDGKATLYPVVRQAGGMTGFLSGVTVYRDDADAVVCVAKIGFKRSARGSILGSLGGDATLVYRGTPSFEGQAPVPDPLGLSGDEADVLSKYYHWATIDSKRVMSPSSDFCVVVGGTADAPKLSAPIYVAEKLNATGPEAVIRSGKGLVVGKVFQPHGSCLTRCLQTPAFRVSGNTDWAAVLLTAKALEGGTGSIRGAFL